MLTASLLFGTLFVPMRGVEAGFFSAIFGDPVYSKNTVLPASVQFNENSQSLALLQANISSASVFEDKANKDIRKNTKVDSSKDAIATVSPNADVEILSDSALVPATGPMGVSDGTTTPDPSLQDTSIYVVRKGDSVSQVANMFGVSVDTIRWANNMKKGDKLTEGDVLLILPVSGLEHTVAKSQTLQSIAKLYKVDVSDITQNNDIPEDAKLVVGDKLIIPDGIKSEENDKPIKNIVASIAKDKEYYKNNPVKNLNGYFINPVPGYRKSQGLHDKNGIDMAIAKGTPILAAAEGRVTLARNGYNGGFGNLVIISHPNGTETLYAHMSKVIATTGSQVYQGQVIGLVGSTGRSTGPHLHLEVHGARNPGVDGSWKY